MPKRWQCDSCGETFKLKRELVDDLQDHVQEYYQELSMAEGQLQELGVKEWDVA